MYYVLQINLETGEPSGSLSQPMTWDEAIAHALQIIEENGVSADENGDGEWNDVKGELENDCSFVSFDHKWSVCLLAVPE